MFPIIWITAILASFSLRAQAMSCARLCSTVDGCESSRYGSYCKGWSDTAICHGLLRKSDGSFCYINPHDKTCSGAPVECIYNDFGIDSVVETTPTTQPPDEGEDNSVTTDSERRLEASNGTPVSAQRRRLTAIPDEFEDMSGNGIIPVWPSRKEVPKPVPTDVTQTNNNKRRRHRIAAVTDLLLRERQSSNGDINL